MIVPANRVIRLGTSLTVALAVPAVVLALLVNGGAGALGAAGGLVIVTLFFSISKVAVGAVARRAPHLLLPAALGTYIVKILLLGVLLVAMEGTDTVHLPSFAWSIFVGVFVWMGAELWVATHTRVPFYDPDRPGAWDTSKRPPAR